ncbi:hypothetical protein [Cohnella sp.]|uniref:hypothetical protein n=1 Tax=Cohnella sp. TaxID=1883426 RepID=UPI0037043719
MTVRKAKFYTIDELSVNRPKSLAQRPARPLEAVNRPNSPAQRSARPLEAV